jgi:hypothetical protein
VRGVLSDVCSSDLDILHGHALPLREKVEIESIHPGIRITSSRNPINVFTEPLDDKRFPARDVGKDLAFCHPW